VIKRYTDEDEDPNAKFIEVQRIRKENEAKQKLRQIAERRKKL
jgi:hypothetical protein